MSKHRRLELTHFCLQYHEWEEAVRDLNLYPTIQRGEGKTSELPDPTFDISARLAVFKDKMAMVRRAASECDPDIGDAIFKAVTEDLAFSYFEARGIACGRDMFYDRLRKFFYLLDKIRI